MTGQKGRLEPGLCPRGLSPSWGREGSLLPAPWVERAVPWGLAALL